MVNMSKIDLTGLGWGVKKQNDSKLILGHWVNIKGRLKGAKIAGEEWVR